ncbi:MAG: hypothetical protein ABUL68_03735 [Pseudomonadota bacterium]
MRTRTELSPEAHQRLLAAHGGEAAAFAGLVGTCVRRFLAQNDRPPLPDPWLAEYAARLWAVVNAAGLPRPLAAGESAEPGEMPADRVVALSARIFHGLDLPGRHADLDTPTRQLLKACLQPEFRQCRDSYREVTDGICRRQEFTRARERVSGSHCVDCPYWTALQPDEHERLLNRAWVSGCPEDLTRHREVFLPEDFRALRMFIWRQIRAT